MILKEIKITNFRQFYGEQDPIVFSEGEKNITIIFGENGDGKTGIFRALMFGLFGTKYLSQDNDKDEIHLVNMIKLKENEGSPVSALVSIKIEHNSETWILDREVIGIQYGDKIEERIDKCKIELNKIDINGNYSPTPITDTEKIREVINNIIDEKIKDFFLFDGEKIETLAKTNKQVKTEIKEAIIKLLQIDKVSTALDILDETYNKDKRSITDKSLNNNVREAQQKLDNIKNRINEEQKIKDTHIENLDRCKAELDRTEMKLSEAKPIREIQDRILVLDKEYNSKSELLDAHKRALRESFFNFGHNIFMEGVYPSTKSYLKQLLVQQNDLVPIEVIKDILLKRECICGAQIDANSKAKEKIENLEKQYQRSQITPFIGQLNGAIDDYNSMKEEISTRIKEKLSKILEIKQEAEEVLDMIDTLKKEKRDKSRDEANLSSLEDNLERHQNEYERIKDLIRKCEISLENYERELRDAEREHQRVISQDASLRSDQRRLGYVERLRDAFLRLFTEYSDDMRKELMDETTAIFKILIDKKDRELIDRVEINSKYEIELHNWNGTRITQDISQGQRQIVALSFITALAKIAASGKETIDFPLFMDTPFGRMSGANRDNLIKHIPELSSQWILLLTDTEFSESEEIMVKSTGRLGRWYRLDQQKVGHTIIREVALNDKMATRR